MNAPQFKAAPSYVGDTETLQVGAWTITARMEYDSTYGAPWKEHDGHGEVTEWTRRSKEPGELVLASDGGSRRYYDFAAACRTARADGWGLSPERLAELEAPRRVAVRSAYHVANGIRQDRITEWRDVPARKLKRREIAAHAARDDFERLRRWCNDEWHWVSFVVTVTDSEGEKLGAGSLGGIESDCGPYGLEVVNEIIGEALSEAAENAAARYAAKTAEICQECENARK